MLKSFYIENFRCFRQLNIEPLERINLIAGQNNVGKTSLLEAILVFNRYQDTSILLEINKARDAKGIGLFREQEAFRLFFFNQDISTLITLKAADNNIQSSVKIHFLNNKYKIESNNIKDSIESSKINLNNDNFSINNYIYSSSKFDNSAELFSNLELIGKQEEVVTSLRILEPRIKRLTILLINHQPIIYGDIGMTQLIPLPLMGEGVGRLLSIILAIANTKRKIILIDEIENGFHYSVLTDVWQAIADAARRFDVQIFATTHSRECILAAHQAFKNGNKYDFRYHRLERVNNEIKAITYDRETLDYSDEMNWEVR